MVAARGRRVLEQGDVSLKVARLLCVYSGAMVVNRWAIEELDRTLIVERAAQN